MDLPEDFDHDILKTIERFEKASSNNESFYYDVEDYLDILDFYLSNNQIKKASSVLSISLGQHPNNIDLQVAKAKVLLLQNQFISALDLLSSIEVIEPYNCELLLTKGSVYSRLKRSEKAILYYNKAISFGALKEDVYVLLAMEHQQNKYFEKAIEFYKLSLKENPENDIVISELGICYECFANYDDGIKYFTQFLEDYPYNESAWFNLAIIYGNKGDYANAISAYEFAIVINPYYSSAYFNMANIQLAKGDYLEAIKTYESSYEIEPPTAVTYSYIAECFENLNDYVNALEYHNKSIMDDESFIDGWLGKAVCLNHLQEYNLAYKSILKAIEIDNEDVDVYYTCSEIEENLGLEDQSLHSMKLALNLDPKDLKLRIEYLILVEKFKGIKEVIVELDLIQEQSFISEIAYYKVATLLKMGSFSEAYELFERTLIDNYDKHSTLFNFAPEALKNQNILELIDIYRS